ncbi:MAG: hypothetical protein ACUVXJ_04245 [Phycisphaerae bacterium]
MMRGIADKSGGGIEQIGTAESAGQRGPTWRSILIGFVGVAVFSLLALCDQNTFRDPDIPLIGNQLPVMAIVLMLALSVSCVVSESRSVL